MHCFDPSLLRHAPRLLQRHGPRGIPSVYHGIHAWQPVWRRARPERSAFRGLFLIPALALRLRLARSAPHPTLLSRAQNPLKISTALSPRACPRESGGGREGSASATSDLAARCRPGEPACGWAEQLLTSWAAGRIVSYWDQAHTADRKDKPRGRCPNWTKTSFIRPSTCAAAPLAAFSCTHDVAVLASFDSRAAAGPAGRTASAPHPQLPRVWRPPPARRESPLAPEWGEGERDRATRPRRCR
jgi:hypothetical protein